MGKSADNYFRGDENGCHGYRKIVNGYVQRKGFHRNINESVQNGAGSNAGYGGYGVELNSRRFRV